jgi:hypothetical protein
MTFWLYILALFIIFQASMLMVGLSKTDALWAKYKGAVMMGGVMIAGVLTSMAFRNWRALSFLTSVYFSFHSIDVLFSARNQSRLYLWLLPLYAMVIVSGILAGMFEWYLLLIVAYAAFWVLTYMLGKRLVAGQ